MVRLGQVRSGQIGPGKDRGETTVHNNHPKPRPKKQQKRDIFDSSEMPAVACVDTAVNGDNVRTTCTTANVWELRIGFGRQHPRVVNSAVVHAV